MTTNQAEPDRARIPTRAQVMAARGIIERYKTGLGPKPSQAVIDMAAAADARDRQAAR